MVSTNILYSEINEGVFLFHKMILIVKKGLSEIITSIITI